MDSIFIVFYVNAGKPSKRFHCFVFLHIVISLYLIFFLAAASSIPDRVFQYMALITFVFTFLNLLFFTSLPNVCDCGPWRAFCGSLFHKPIQYFPHYQGGAAHSDRGPLM